MKRAKLVGIGPWRDLKGASPRRPLRGDRRQFRIPIGDVDGLIDLPSAFPRRRFAGHCEQSIEAISRDQREAELRQMPGQMLAVVEDESPTLQMTIERRKADLRGVA